MTDKILKPEIHWKETIFLFFLFLISVTQIKDPLFLLGIITSLFLACKIQKINISLNLADFCIIIIWLYNFILQFTSLYPTNGVGSLKIITLSTFYYFIIRFGFKEMQKIKNLLLCYSTFIGVICLLAIITFYLFAETIYNGGFSDLYNFRFRFHPLGYISNVWGTMQLGFMGIIVLTMYFYKNNKKIFFPLLICLILVLFCVIVTFSRGIYLSILFLLLAFFTGIILSKISHLQKFKIIVISFAIFSILIYPFRHEVRQTLRFNETLSQQRSINSRIEGFKASQILFKEYPLTGVGCGNYILAINPYRFENDNNYLTSYAPNSYIQLLTEQGIIGISLWLFFIIILTIPLFKKNTWNPATKIIFSSLAAIFIREASFPVFLEHSGLQLIIFTLVAIYQNSLEKVPNSQVVTLSNKNQIISILILLLCTPAVCYSLSNSRNEKYNQQFIVALKSNHFKEAEELISKSGERLPYLINRNLLYWKWFQHTNDSSHLSQAKYYLKQAMAKNPYDISLQQRLALILNKEGRRDSAQLILKQLVKQFPNNTRYCLCYFEFLNQNNNWPEAVPYLEKVILLSPHITESSTWKEMVQRDSAKFNEATHNLCQKIREELKSNFVNDPIVLAKYGKILFTFQYDTLAKQTLERTVSLLPSLTYPWLYLSLLEMKYNPELATQYMKHFIILNTQTYLSRAEIDALAKSVEINKKLYEKRNIYTSYIFNFTNWYKSYTLEFENQST